VSVGALVAAVLLLGANAFFVASEFALVAAQRTRVEPLAAGGSRAARAALDAMGDLNVQLAGAQLGITMASLGLGVVAEPAVARTLEGPLEAVFDPPAAVVHAVAFVIALTIVVFLHLVLGEMVPKNVAIAGPERTLLVLALPNKVYVTMFGPLIRVLTGAANLVVRAGGVEPRSELATAHTAEEFASMLAHSRHEGEIGDFQADLLTGVLDFDARPVSLVMVRRADIVSIEAGCTVAEAEALAVSSGHSRLPVRAGQGDDLTGFLHTKDLLSLSSAARSRPVPQRLVRRMLRVPTDRSLGELLLAMRSARTHVAVVVDGEGRTCGLVTLEDLLEELVGDIRDETDRA
jgi:CBS domain containing-hemolysin-like protein